MDFSYLITPFLAWLATGIIKFTINSFQTKHLAFNLIGYGGMPSNHSAIVTSMATLISLKEGINNAAFGVALALAFIVILDASSLRREVGRHATMINKLLVQSKDQKVLRERIGHTHIEIAAGILVGIAVAISVNVTDILISGDFFFHQ
jgi:hypothetical protein